MMKKLSSIIVASGLVLSACSTGNEEEENSKDQKQEKHMNHKSKSKAPDNMKSTDDIKYKKDDKITITADNMPSMKNTKGTLKGANKTYAYFVSYTPTNGDEKLNNYKWVIKEGVANDSENGFKKGDTVKLEAGHMPGMKGAEVQIDDVEKTTVYMVDYKSTENDEMVKNHKWMTTDELKSR